MSVPASDGTVTPGPSASVPSVPSVPKEKKPETKETKISQNLQSLLVDHKAQSRIVQRLQDELNELKEIPERYLQNRKRFLYYAYTRNLDQCKKLDFDVKVRRLLESLTSG